MTDAQRETLKVEFSRPLINIESVQSQVQLTLTPWEVRELVRRVERVMYEPNALELGAAVRRLGLAGS